MGTGAVYLTLSGLKNHADAVTVVETVFYLLNIALFSLNSTTLLLQFICKSNFHIHISQSDANYSLFSVSETSAANYYGCVERRLRAVDCKKTPLQNSIRVFLTSG